MGKDFFPDPLLKIPEMRLSLYLLPLIFFAGCLTNTDDLDPSFGYRYSLIETEEYPVISKGSLTVKVQYGGCNGDHDFMIQHRKVSPEISEVWLYKQTPDQICDALFQEIRSFKLPVEVFSSNQIYVIGPDDTRTLIR